MRFVCLIVLILTAGAAAAGPGNPTDKPALHQTPMMAAIQALLDREKAGLADLQAGLQLAKTDADFQAIQREISAVKRNTELEILRVQLDFALAEDRAETAAELEAAINAILFPKPVIAPESRSIPRPRRQ